ncbi:Scr1 family TA system antitoxin-like transcriptional regulator [Streptomyces atratus]
MAPWCGGPASQAPHSPPQSSATAASSQSARSTHLLKKPEQANVTLLVIPFEAGAFPGAGQTVLYAEGPVPQLDTVQIDNSHGPLFVHAGVQLLKYQGHLE